jgi:sugar lactone lactonase YvrE
LVVCGIGPGKEKRMDIVTLELQPFVEGIGFGEAPRWHDGALWLSDIVRHEVLRVDASGTIEVVARTAGEPSGLGWLPDGSLLVVQMDEHEIWNQRDGKLHRYSGTVPMSRYKLNDMVVDAKGRAWVSNIGFNYEQEPACSTNLICVDPGGHAWIAAPDLWCPNGMALNASGEILFVGQSASPEVLEFAIDPRGVLGERSVFGSLPEGAVCDGICLDAEDGLWIASPTTREFLRMTRGGTITHRVPTPGRHAIACVLGGKERRTLYAITAATMSLRSARGHRDGRIEMLEVEIPGAGQP